jgi:hypothetical protein
VRKTLLLLPCFLASACSTIPLARIHGKELALERKAVSSKRAIHDQAQSYALVADDGSQCPVSYARYQKTLPGDDSWCVWR